MVASRKSDAASPLLNDHANGGALELMKYGLKKAKKEEVVVKGAVRLAPQIVSATQGEVSLRDCVDGTNWLQYKLNGERKNDVPGTHRKADAKVERDGEGWKVSHLYLYEAGTC